MCISQCYFSKVAHPRNPSVSIAFSNAKLIQSRSLSCPDSCSHICLYANEALTCFPLACTSVLNHARCHQRQQELIAHPINKKVGRHGPVDVISWHTRMAYCIFYCNAGSASHYLYSVARIDVVTYVFCRTNDRVSSRPDIRPKGYNCTEYLESEQHSISRIITFLWAE